MSQPCFVGLVAFDLPLSVQPPDAPPLAFASLTLLTASQPHTDGWPWPVPADVPFLSLCVVLQVPGGRG